MIGMFKDVLKSLILFSLIISSIVLTYKIWNYTPELTNVESSIEEKIPTIGPRNNDNIRSIFMPFQIISYSEQNVQGTSDSDAIMDLTNYIAGSKVEKMSLLDNKLSGDIANRYVIFDFTVNMPNAMYLTSVLDLDNKLTNGNMFNRLIIDSESHSELILYLISDKKMLKVQTNAESKPFNKLLNQYNEQMIKYSGIITNEITTDEKTNVYAPSNAKHAKTYRYMADRINVEDINNAVLDEKEHVIERTRKNGSTTYFGNTGVVSITQNSIYKYNNLSQTDSVKREPYNNLVKSFSFISKHGGFTDDYRLFSVYNENNSIDYQMFLSGLPVFNNSGLSEINVTWGDKEIYEYRRGLLSTSVAVPSTTTTKNLPSAEQVRFALASNKHYQFEEVTHLLIGYEMKISEPSDLQIQSTLLFEPNWYVNYKGEWKKFEDGRLK